jgi:hypothetical protein
MINNIKIKAEAVLEASKEDGLEVNAKRTKYVSGLGFSRR